MPGYPSEQEILEYVKHEKSFNVRPGDIVFIFRKAKSHEGGWRNSWIEEMDFAVGKYGLVSKIDLGGYGILIRIGSDEYWYPYTCLRIVR